MVDNITRASLWVAAIYYSQAYYYNNNSKHHNNNVTQFESMYCYIIMISGIYCTAMEWFCLLAMQIEAVKAQMNWKSRDSMTAEIPPPAIIIKVFSNGFRNRYGFVVIGSTFALPWWLCASFNGYNHFLITLLITICWFGRVTCTLLVWYFIAKFARGLDNQPIETNEKEKAKEK